MALCSPSSFILDEDFFKGPSFDEWLEGLRSDLNSEQIGYVLAADCPTLSDMLVSEEGYQLIEKWTADNDRARSRIINTISRGLQVLVGVCLRAARLCAFLEVILMKCAGQHDYTYQRHFLRARWQREIMSASTSSR